MKFRARSNSDLMVGEKYWQDDKLSSLTTVSSQAFTHALLLYEFNLSQTPACLRCNIINDLSKFHFRFQTRLPVILAA